MTTFSAEVMHVVGPDERDDHDLTPYLERISEDRYVLVVRRGGTPSLLDRVLAFLRRDPIEAVTVITDDEYEEGDELQVTATATEMQGVFDATDVRKES